MFYDEDSKQETTERQRTGTQITLSPQAPSFKGRARVLLPDQVD